jgi:hypothetical protein
MKRLIRAAARLAHDAVQYFRDALLMDDWIKRESSVIRRMPTHWMAKPTFESIDRNLVEGDERVGTKPESFWAGRSRTQGRARRPAGNDFSRGEALRPRVFLSVLSAPTPVHKT